MTDLDPVLRETMARVGVGIDARPSLADVHRRVRRHSRRRLAVAASALACAGLAATALVIRTNSPVATTSGQTLAPNSTLPALVQTTTTSSPSQVGSVTTLYPLPTSTITPALAWYALWNARHDPSGLALSIDPADQAAAKSMPTPDQFDCVSDACRALFNYVEWHEIARLLGFHDVSEMQARNPAIDVSQPPHEGDVLQSSPEAGPENSLDEPATTASPSTAS